MEIQYLGNLGSWLTCQKQRWMAAPCLLLYHFAFQIQHTEQQQNLTLFYKPEWYDLKPLEVRLMESIFPADALCWVRVTPAGVLSPITHPRPITARSAGVLSAQGGPSGGLSYCRKAKVVFICTSPYVTSSTALVYARLLPPYTEARPFLLPLRSLQRSCSKTQHMPTGKSPEWALKWDHTIDHSSVT